MRKLLFIPILITSFTFSYSQQNHADKSWDIKGLGKFETVITDSSGRFSNLKQFDKYWSEAQIISLGEQTHFDGATFDAKVQLIKHLHEQLGYNVLAFESGYYELTKAAELLSKQQQNTLKQAVFGVWDTKALKSLEDYILQTQLTPNPLRVTGFDFQFSGTLAAKYFINDLEVLLSNLGATDIITDLKWDQFKSATAKQIKFSNFYKKPSPQDTALIGSVARHIITFLETKKGEANANVKGLNSWQEACQHLVFDSQHRYQSKNYRDSLMARNLVQLSNDEFNGEKIICWNATSHFIYNPTLIEDEDYKRFVPMGHYLHKQLGDKFYTIGFTSFNGKAGSVIKYKLKPPPAHSLEYAFGEVEADYGFIDFHTAPAASTPRKISATRMLGNQFLNMQLEKVVSGIFYIKEAYPPK